MSGFHKELEIEKSEVDIVATYTGAMATEGLCYISVYCSRGKSYRSDDVVYSKYKMCSCSSI